MNPPLIYTYALTTLERVKTRLGITNTTYDVNLIRAINSATDHIEQLCGVAGNHHFVNAEYINGIAGKSTLWKLRRTLHK